VLGEDLVMFRTPDGKVGLVVKNCAHRGASLEFGRVEPDGIRCPYHGWVFAHDGHCTETPMEPDGSTLKDRVCQKAYVAMDAGGLVFAYLGPLPAPEMPRYDCLFEEGVRRMVWGRDVHNNWLQAVENPVDPFHVMVTHTTLYPELAMKRPTVEWTETPWGIQMDQTVEGGFAERYFHVFPGAVRVNVQRVGQEPVQYLIYQTPRDDTSTVAWFVWVAEDRTPPHWTKSAPYQKTVPGEWKRVDDGWWGLWERDQDDAVINSQGLIADRTQEHLGASDKGVVMLRRMMRDAIEDVQAGRDPKAVVRTRHEIIRFDCWKRGLGSVPGQLRKQEEASRIGIIAPYEAQ
jgi:5,5'-dehydrodivanillate O-demethylase